MSVSQTSADASRPNQLTATLILLHGSSLPCLLYCRVSLSVVRFCHDRDFVLFHKVSDFPMSQPRDSSVGTTSHYGLDGPGIESRRFSAPIQTGLGAQPASYTVGIGSFMGLKRSRRGGDYNHQLEPRLKKKYSYHMVCHSRCVFVNYNWINQLSNTTIWWLDICCLLHRYQLHVSALMAIFRLTDWQQNL